MKLKRFVVKIGTTTYVSVPKQIVQSWNLKEKSVLTFEYDPAFLSDRKQVNLLVDDE